VTAASLTRQDDPPAHLFGRHEPTMVHYRLAEQGRFRLSKPVLRWNSTWKVRAPKGRAREVRSAREDPCYELAPVR
jgi:hypothetical protein